MHKPMTKDKRLTKVVQLKPGRHSNYMYAQVASGNVYVHRHLPKTLDGMTAFAEKLHDRDCMIDTDHWELIRKVR